MGKTVVVTGGARSGKSQYAEDRVQRVGDRILYVATSIVTDEEMKKRVEIHQKRRPSSWDTYEGYQNLSTILEGKKGLYDGILIDCMTLLTTNLFLQEVGLEGEALNPKKMQQTQQKILIEIESLINSIKSSEADVFLVTNEIGWGIVPEYALARAFRDLMGTVNKYIAKEADEVILTVSGIPMKIKG